MINVSMHFAGADKYRNPFVLVGEQSGIQKSEKRSIIVLSAVC